MQDLFDIKNMIWEYAIQDKFYEKKQSEYCMKKERINGERGYSENKKRKMM